ncbi:OsmC family protein [Ideonella sp. BN130291]|uniref:OsmC family protein n=1 Tax=Ideonella sp. BN130291 TaxID=3112940 RepID=UPI002E25DE33|nr:OsmC family protein [Ideonella sp. BN130291]
MHLYTAQIDWTRGDAAFTDNRYSRAHEWRFDGGAVVPASSSPLSVRVPYSNPANVDPEEAFVAALSSCHMLTFLWLAGREGLCVDRYSDAAEGVMEDIGHGRQAVTRATLRPEVVFSGTKRPSDADVERLHHSAHEQCYIANSVKTEITVQGRWQHAG